MLRSIRCQNFKAFADTGEIDVRPLTLLLGPNSSGKSSLIQSLLLLKQTADSRNFTNALVTHGDYVKLGEYRDFVHGQDRSRHLAFQLTFDTLLTYSSTFRSTRAIQPVAPIIGLDIEFAYNKRMLRPVLQHAVVTADAAPVFRRLEIRLASNGKFVGSMVREGGIETKLPVVAMRKFYSPEFKRRSLRRPRAVAAELLDETLYANMAWMDITAAIETLFRNMYYLGPLRDEPHRVYVATGEQPGDVGLKGERSIDVLWHALRKKATREALLGKVNHWLRRFGIAVEVDLARVGGNNYSVTLEDPYSHLVVNLVDVGFGASQLLPLIVQAFSAPDQSTILIEQPEIHLHPSAQAELGDLLLEITQTRRTVIAETHSEQLFRRIQRRVAESPGLRSQLAIYYAEPTQAGTLLRRVELNELGQVDPDSSPAGLFETGYAESRAITEALGRRTTA